MKLNQFLKQEIQMGNSRDKNIEISYEDLVHPLIKNRIVLDYPLDVLLNRECLLQDYENRVIRSLKEYNIL